jgi:PAS domain S-box-containing protein
MAPVLRILHLEDNATDAQLIAAMLAADGLGCQCDHVATRPEFVAGLDGEYDLILSDYSLPGFDGVTAQQMARERRPDLPFVFVSGTMGEEVAIERLNAGATDFVLKQRLERLPRAVRRALQEAHDRKERSRAEAEVRRLNEELEARVVERTRQLAEANIELADRKIELERAKAFLDSVVENLPAVVFVKGARDRQYVSLNRAGEEVLGLARREVLGRTDEDLFPAAMAERFRKTDTDVLQGRTPVSIVDEVVATRGREPRILHTKKIPIAGADGAPEYLLGIALDITERRHAEEEARLARLEAERANHAKSQFVSRMSHDLRTPLNAILGFAELLETDAGLSAEQVDNVRHILNGGAHLLELINEVLDISRIEAGQLSLSLQPVRVSEVLRDVVELLRPLADARGISMSLPVEGPHGWHVRADRQRLKQILLNLVGNAVKYNRNDGAVRITAGQVADRVRIRVSDTGPGIPAGKLGLLFQPFERLGAERSPVEGTGLGLASAKGLVEAMNGAIGAEAPGEGATFWIELPEAGPTEDCLPERVRQPSAGAPPGGGTVLYIEDNRANVRLLERLLSRRPGVRLLVAETGGEGIAFAVRERPSVILLDLHLPDIAGEEVLRRLLEDRRTRGLPVILLSADATPAQRERLLQAGARAYLTKPLALPSVLALIDQHLAEPRALPVPE